MVLARVALAFLPAYIQSTDCIQFLGIFNMQNNVFLNVFIDFNSCIVILNWSNIIGKKKKKKEVVDNFD